MTSSMKLESTWLKAKYTETMIEKIGIGGFGCVYSFLDPKSGITKAVKVIERPGGIDSQKWMNEASLEIDNMLELNECDQVLKLESHYVDFKNNRIFLVTELATNSLDKIKRRLTEDELVQLCRELLAGLLFAHERKIVHRDIKLANILISKSGSFLISDWGISRTMNLYGTQSQRFTAKGTAGYLAPEIYEHVEGERKEINLYKADVYAAGLLLLVGCGIAEMDLEKGIRTIDEKKHQKDIDSLLKKKDPKYLPEIDDLIKMMTKFDDKRRADIFEANDCWKDIEKKLGETKKIIPKDWKENTKERKENEISRNIKKII